MAPGAPTRVVIVEDHVLFAESLQMALELNGYDVVRPNVQLPGGSAGGLFAAVMRARPDLVIVDLNLGRAGDGVLMIEPLAAAGAAVLVVTGTLDRTTWGECLRLGARGVVAKTQPLRETLDAVGRITTGRSAMPSRERDRLVREWQLYREVTHDARGRFERLTAREAEVLGGLMQGRAVRAIAARHVVSEATVRTQVKSILAKLEVSSQLAAVGLAHEVRWAPLDEKPAPRMPQLGHASG